MQDAMWAALTEFERQQVLELLGIPTSSKPAEDYLAGEYVQIAGTIPLGHGRWLQRGIYCVLRRQPDGMQLMRYGSRKRIEVPFNVTLTKYPVGLLVLSERAAARVVVEGEAAA